MEFSFNINNLLGEEITKLDSSLRPFKNQSSDYRQQLHHVVDKMGEASAKAQGLHGPITSAQKVRTSTHDLYIMKDAAANGGKGAVVGILKMGRKRLFMYDPQGVNHEREPLCTLDFYVHESRQRLGGGKRMYEFMLAGEGVKPYQIAIDRPSPKFLGFLSKHYNLKASIPQVNNFVVFEGFFRDKQSHSALDRRKGMPGKPPLHPYRREGSIANDVASSSSNSLGRAGHFSPQSKLVDNFPLPRQGPFDSLHNGLGRPPSGQSGSNIGNLELGQGADRPGSRSMGAHTSGYSRHGKASPAPPLDLDAVSHGNNGRLPQLRRDGPSSDFMQLHHPREYQDRRGHLKVAPLAGPTSGASPGPLARAAGLQPSPNAGHAGRLNSGTGDITSTAAGAVPQSGSLPSASAAIPWSGGLPPGNPYSAQSSKPRNRDTSWNIFGVPNDVKASEAPTQPAAKPAAQGSASTSSPSRRYRNLYW